MICYPLDYFEDVHPEDLSVIDAHVHARIGNLIDIGLIREVRAKRDAAGLRSLSQQERFAFDQFVMLFGEWYRQHCAPESIKKATRENCVRVLDTWETVTDDADFDALVAGDRWVLVAWLSSGCKASWLMGKALAATHERFGEQLQCVVARRSRAPQLAARFAVTGLPTFLLFKQGGIKSVARGGGLSSTEWLLRLDQHIKTSSL